MKRAVIIGSEVAAAAGKAIKSIERVAATGETFSIAFAYDHEVTMRGFTMGSMCRDQPRGLSKHHDRIAKWDNLSFTDYKHLDGIVCCEDNRDGKEAYIVLFE